MKMILLSLATMTSFAAVAAERPYLVEPMECFAVQTSKNPGQASGYDKEKLTFTSMLSTRRDGSLAPALEIKRDFASNTYLSPLMISEQGTLQKVIGAYDETLSLKIVASRIENGQRIDLLSGTTTARGTVIGNTSYALRCRAVVVQSVKRIDDLRAKK